MASHSNAYYSLCVFGFPYLSISLASNTLINFKIWKNCNWQKRQILYSRIKIIKLFHRINSNIFTYTVPYILILRTVCVLYVYCSNTLNFIRNQIVTKVSPIRQVSSMIHSAKSTVSPVANIVFALFCFARF